MTRYRYNPLVTIAQLATWIERDGLTCSRYTDDGGREYDTALGTVIVYPDLVDELDAERDRIYPLLARRGAAR